MSFLGGLGAVAGLASNLFGSKSKGSTPAQSTSMSGFQVLPKQVQNAYLQNYLPSVLNYGKSGPNQYTQQAINSYGGGLAGLMQELPGYKSIFDQNTVQPTLDEIQRQSDIQQNRLRAQAAASGLGGIFNSNTAIQLGELQRNADMIKAQQLADFNRENTINALRLRGQTLSDLMTAGDQDYNRLSRFAGLLGVFPGGNTSTQIGASQPKPNIWDKVIGSAVSLPGIINAFRVPQQIDLGNAMPWLQ